jgi:uncharacterized ParB-like nuclease family protein
MGSGEQPLSRKIVTTVAEMEETDPTDLTRPLARAIDTDAVEMIFRDTTGELTFEYLDYEVTVDSADRVEVQPVDGE